MLLKCASFNVAFAVSKYDDGDDDDDDDDDAAAADDDDDDDDAPRAGDSSCGHDRRDM